jgi:hypothetical protein
LSPLSPTADPTLFATATLHGRLSPLRLGRCWQLRGHQVLSAATPRSFAEIAIDQPFVEDIIGKKLQIGSGLSVDCMTCNRHVIFDVPALARRLGDDHGCMDWDQIKVLYCQPCREAGRADRNLASTSHPRTLGKRR